MLRTKRRNFYVKIDTFYFAYRRVMEMAEKNIKMVENE